MVSLEKYIFNYRYRERLETDSEVGDSVVEKRRLNPDGNSARKTGSKKETTWGKSVFLETDPTSLFLGLLIYLLLQDCVTLLLPLWRKAQVHASIRDED